MATEKAMAMAEYESEQRRTLNRLAKLREERLQRKLASHLPEKETCWLTAPRSSIHFRYIDIVGHYGAPLSKATAPPQQLSNIRDGS